MDLALSDFIEAIKLDSNYGEAYFNRRLALSNLDHGQKAITDFEKAV